MVPARELRKLRRLRASVEKVLERHSPKAFEDFLLSLARLPAEDFETLRRLEEGLGTKRVQYWLETFLDTPKAVFERSTSFILSKDQVKPPWFVLTEGANP